MADNTETGVKFSADTSAVDQGMKAAAASVNAGVTEMREHFAKLNESFGMITKGFGMVMAAMAGGSAFKEFVNDAAAVTKESLGLGKALGITATEASVLRSALAVAGVSQDAVAAAGKRLSMAMATGGKAIEDFGVSTKDSNGHFKDSETIMLEVNERLAQFKEGTDRNIEGVKIYGRAWTEVAPMIGKVDTSSMEAAEEHARSLNLVVGEESVAAVKAYGLAQRESKEVYEGISRTIGDALIPRLTALGQWFSSIGPQAVEATRGVMATYLVIQDAIADSAKALWDMVVQAFSAIGNAISDCFGDGGTSMTAMEFFKNVLKTIQIAVIGFRVGFQLAIEAIKTYIEALLSKLRTFADLSVAAMHLDWNGVKQAWDDGTARSEKILADSMARMVAIAKKGGEDIEAAAMGNPLAAKKVTATKKKEGGLDSTGAPDAAKDGPDKRLAEWKAELQGRKEAEKDYFKDSTQADLAYWQGRLANVTGESEKDKQLRRQINSEIYNLNKQQATQDRALSDEQIANAKKLGDEILARRKQDADAQLALGKITEAEKLALYTDVENTAYQIDVQRLTDLSKLYEKDKVAYQKYQDELLQIKLKHDNELAKLQNQADQADQKRMQQMLAPFTSAMQKSIDGIIQGTTTMQKALSNIFQSIALEFVNQAVKKMVDSWIAGEQFKIIATRLGLAEVLGLQKAGAAASAMTKTTEVTAVVGANAAEAASGAAASQAPIPVVGPGLAAAAFASVGALVKGAMSMFPGFEVGAWNVPGDMFTKVHAGETILPPGDAAKFRAGVEGGGSGSSGSPIHIHGTPDDTIKLRDLPKVLRQLNRDFAFVGR